MHWNRVLSLSTKYVAFDVSGINLSLPGVLIVVAYVLVNPIEGAIDCTLVFSRYPSRMEARPLRLTVKAPRKRHGTTTNSRGSKDLQRKHHGRSTASPWTPRKHHGDTMEEQRSQDTTDAPRNHRGPTTYSSWGQHRHPLETSQTYHGGTMGTPRTHDAGAMNQPRKHPVHIAEAP